MKGLYTLLKKEVLDLIPKLESAPVQENLPKETISTYKQQLSESRDTLDKLLRVLEEKDLDVIRLISSISKLKGLEPGKNEDDIMNELMLKAMFASEK